MTHILFAEDREVFFVLSGMTPGPSASSPATAGLDLRWRKIGGGGTYREGAPFQGQGKYQVLFKCKALRRKPVKITRDNQGEEPKGKDL